MKSEKQLRFYNSTVAFVLAGIVSTTLHEIAHFISFLLLDGGARLTPGYVLPIETTTVNHVIWGAAAGPMFSLTSGLILIAVAKKWGSGFMRLFWLWLGFLSAQIGFGYMLISSFAKDGDTGLALDFLHAHWSVYLIITAIGALGTYYLLPKMFAQLAGRYVKDKKEFFQLGTSPWLIGTAILVAIYAITEVVIMNDNGSALLSLIGVATTGIFMALAKFYYKPQKTKEKLILAFPTKGIAITVVVTLALVFGLSSGLALGSY